MAQPKIRWRLFISIGVVLVFVTAIGEVAPWSVTKAYYCTSCRAGKTEERVLGFSLVPAVGENNLSVYWRKEVEPNHKHTWRCYHTRERYLMSWLVACGRYGRADKATINAEVAALASFKSRTERLAFAKSFVAWNLVQESGERNDWHDDALRHISDAYQQNPNRKDWPQLLKKLGITK